MSMINISPVISPMYRLYWWHESEDTAGCWCDSPTGLVIKYIGQNNNYGSIRMGPLSGSLLAVIVTEYDITCCHKWPPLKLLVLQTSGNTCN